MQWTNQEERKILDGLKTFVDVFVRSIAEQSAKEHRLLSQTPQPSPRTDPKKLAPPEPAPARPKNIPHLIPVMKWNEHHEYPTIGSLRWLIFNADKTGFDKVIRRVGRRVLIDEAAFFEWVGAEKSPSRS